MRHGARTRNLIVVNTLTVAPVVADTGHRDKRRRKSRRVRPNKRSNGMKLKNWLSVAAGVVALGLVAEPAQAASPGEPVNALNAAVAQSRSVQQVWYGRRYGYRPYYYPRYRYGYRYYRPRYHYGYRYY